ncbi:MAG: redoxin domain-containing protein [Desulfatitalea sp.]|nr:redoxin domain-containing protein [Desulfatitalea sp.]NNK02455.1 redoxin domain-containing protein [Desulfatitalea sp.]
MRRWGTGRLAAGMMMMLLFVFLGCEIASIFEIGDTVPDFTMPDQHGEMISLSNALGETGTQGAILAFYILDNSPG